MRTLADIFERPVGYSDHTIGVDIALAAAALGARIIEKHFTLDRTLPGPDHKASLEPDELAAMVVRVRETAAAMGDGVKRPVSALVKSSRKSIPGWKTVHGRSPGRGRRSSVIAAPSHREPEEDNSMRGLRRAPSGDGGGGISARSAPP